MSSTPYASRVFPDPTALKAGATAPFHRWDTGWMRLRYLTEDPQLRSRRS